MRHGEEAATADCSLACRKWSISDVRAYLSKFFFRHDSSGKHMTWAQSLLADSFWSSQPHNGHSPSSWAASFFLLLPSGKVGGGELERHPLREIERLGVDQNPQ